MPSSRAFRLILAGFIAAAVPIGAAPAQAPAPAEQAAAPAEAAAPAPAQAAATPVAAGSFAIVDAVPMPAARRFGKASVYPFDALAVGQAFFVPATEDRPKPSKSMASTVNSATARYAVEEPAGSGKFKETRKFNLRHVPDGAAFGYPGVSGAGVWRTA